jgi:hypothetical protein
MAEYIPLDEISFQAWVSNTITESIDYIDTELSPDRARAMRYYLAEPFADSGDNPVEQEGRSQYQAKEIHDAVQQCLPSIMRTLFSAEHVVEFEPRQADDVPLAQQATEYCNYLLKDRLDGYTLLDTVIKDALIKGVGIAQIWYEEQVETIVRELTGITQEVAAAVMQQGQWEITSSSQSEDGLFNLTLSKTSSKGKVCVDAVPPEEFLINRNAVSLKDAKILARRQRLTVSDLVDMGYDPELVMQYADVDDTYKSNEEWLLRNPTWREEEQTESDPANREVLYIEAYVNVDLDGDGRAERRKICCMGSAYNIVRNVVVDDHPFVVFRMSCLPHHWSGESLFDELADIQRTKSATMRNMLDSLALATTPRVAYVEGQVDYDELSNDEVGALIAMRQPGAIQQLTIDYVGQQAQPMLEYLDRVSQKRTGLTDASQGLEASSLQSTTAIAIDSQVKAAQARLELITRTLIETGIKPLFEKMLLLITYHQQQQDMMMLRGEYIPIDPSGWPLMNVRVSLPIGGADVSQKSQLLMTILQKQESLLQLMGPDNQFAGLVQYGATLQRLLELNGITDAQTFFGDPQAVLQQLQQQQAQAQQEPQKSPEQVIAEAEVQVKQMDMLGKAASDAREDDRKRDQMSIDLWLKASELKAKYPGIQLDATALVQELQRNRELDVIEQRNQVERYQQALNAVGMQQQQAQQAMQAEQAMQPQQPMPPEAPVN